MDVIQRRDLNRGTRFEADQRRPYLGGHSSPKWVHRSLHFNRIDHSAAAQFNDSMTQCGQFDPKKRNK